MPFDYFWNNFCPEGMITQVIAIIADTTGTALGTMQTSCLPLISSSTFSILPIFTVRCLR